VEGGEDAELGEGVPAGRPPPHVARQASHGEAEGRRGAGHVVGIDDHRGGAGLRGGSEQRRRRGHQFTKLTTYRRGSTIDLGTAGTDPEFLTASAARLPSDPWPRRTTLLPTSTKVTRSS